MKRLDLTLPTLAENLALDEALLLEAEAGRGFETLRFWEWTSPAVVLGAACRFNDDVRADQCRSDAVPVARRASGGGTVLLDKGCLNFTLILAYARDPQLADIRSSYCFILGCLCRALANIAPGLHCSGTSDLVMDDRKVSGNSQQRKRDFLLHHGTLLYDFNVAKVSRYLSIPERQPDYRRERDHADFLANLGAERVELERSLAAAWQATETETAWPAETVARLVESRYRQEDWLHRR